MPPDEKNRSQDGLEANGSEEPQIVDLYRSFSGGENREAGGYPGYSILSVWLGILILAGMVGFGFYQTRAWVEGVRKGMEQVSQENKLLLEGLDELLARADGSDQSASVEPSQADLSGQDTESADRRPSDNLSRRYKIYYRAKEGEDLALVSKKFGVSEDQLRLWNTLNPQDSLIPGQVLVINKSTSPEDQKRVARVFTPPDAGSPVAKKEESAPPETESAVAPSDTQEETAPAQGETALEETGIDEAETTKGTGEPVAPEAEEEIAETAEAAETGADEPFDKAPLAPDEEIIHTVQAGETLSEIGQVYGIPWQILAEYNHIDRPETLYEGQKLLVPGDPAQRTARRGDELTHTVLAGENLYRIGLKYGLSWEQIAKENNMSDAGLLYEGQVLKIPAARGGPEF